MSLLILGLNVSVGQADAAQLGLPGVHLPSLARIEGWFQSPDWGWLPTQIEGTAAGKSHFASAASTRAGKGNGRAPGTGIGQNAAYSAARQTKTGKSGVTQKGVFDPRTSKRVPAKSSATMTWYQNADGSITKKIAEYPVNY